MSAFRLRAMACLAATAALVALAATSTVAEVSQDARPVPHIMLADR